MYKEVIYDKDFDRIPVKLWMDSNKVEDGALEQIRNLSNLPFAFHHIAIMPDVHQGYGMPIGGVLAAEGVVIPNAVGVDIGCGMCAIKTSLKVEQLGIEKIKKIMNEIRKVIPVGLKHHKEKQDESLMPQFNCVKCDENFNYPICWNEYNSALTQLGTLGGGNHFIEIQKDKDGFVWIMLHSGSRNLGYKVAKHYNDLAIKLNEKWHSKVPKEWELAFLPLDTEEGQAYLREMQYCINFAFVNRKLMIGRILEVLCYEFHKTEAEIRNLIIEKLTISSLINIAHNYARMEHHFGRDVMVHRKGATCVRKGDIGIIPGSQGTSSYIVEGLGNKDSFESCSHGAGRLMSRTKAQENLNLEDEIKKLNDKGIVHGIRNKKDLDEASGAYKNIDEVMENQKDLVKILHKLEPMAVIKGD